MEFYLGTWQVAPSDGFWAGQDISQSEKVISCAIKLGVRGFDTAQSYGKGQAEQTLAKVLRRVTGLTGLTKPTSSTSLSSSTNLTSPTSLTSSTSLTSLTKTLQIDTKIMPSTKSVSEILRISQNRLSPFPIDCLYLHWPRSGFDNTAFIREMAALKEEGQINKVGVCNMPFEELRKIVKDGIVPDRIQIPISLLWTRDLAETLAFCKEKKIQIAAYSPTGMGLLSGKYRNSSDLKDARSNLFCFSEQCRRQYLELLDVIEEVARRHNGSCTKVALSWTCAKKPDIILLGARTEVQLKENLSDPIELGPSEMSELDNAARRLDEASAGVCDNIFSYRW